MKNNRKIAFTPIVLIGLIFLTSCSLTRWGQVYDDYIIVKAVLGDTPSSLADTYLDDPTKGWMITEFNETESITPNQMVIIPLKPFRKGGIKTEGYQTIPVISYHRVSASGKTNAMTVSEQAFKAQMNYLKENGYSVISIDEFMDFLDFKIQVPQKSVLITFDDGWRSTYDIAYPILKSLNFPATLFVYTDLVGTQKALSWSQIQKLSKNGFSIQAHSKTHRNLVEMKKGESFSDYYSALVNELASSKEMIERKVGKQCNYFAYTYGAYTNLVISLLKKHEYRGAFTVNRGPNPFFSGNYTINRSVIYGKDDIEKFKKNIGVFKRNTLR